MDRRDSFFQKFQAITETFLKYGWIVSPYMIGHDFEKVYSLSEKIKSKPPSTVQEKAKYHDEINELLTDIIFHPLFRAFFVHRAHEVKYVREFSHHIERAILHYYKNDFFSAVHCLLPAIEGVLLAYRHWQYGHNRKPSIEKLIAEIELCKAGGRDPVAYQLYSKSLTSFLREWIFSDTSIADFTTSFLNRHYILHGMGNANYYSLADAQRLIMFFDIFIEYLSIEQGIKYVFIPDDNEKINSRSTYYFNLIEKDPHWSEMSKAETTFMEDNSNFCPEKNIPDWSKMVAKATLEYIELFKTLINIRNNKNK